MMQNFCVVLVTPLYAGNVGSIARSMMNFGLNELRVVNPKVHLNSQECLERAVIAKKIIQSAKKYSSLKEAVSDCQVIIGTSGKRREGRLNWKTARELAREIASSRQRAGLAMTEKVALVFGSEDQGLTNEDLLLCDYVINIPTHPQFPSLNLSHAATIIFYEIFLALEGEKLSLQGPKKQTEAIGQANPAPVQADWERNLASSEQKERLFEKLKEALLAVGYLDQNNPDRMMREIRNVFNRAHLDEKEVEMWLSICRKIELSKNRQE